MLFTFAAHPLCPADRHCGETRGDDTAVELNNSMAMKAVIRFYQVNAKLQEPVTVRSFSSFGQIGVADRLVEGIGLGLLLAGLGDVTNGNAF